MFNCFDFVSYLKLTNNEHENIAFSTYNKRILYGSDSEVSVT